MNNTKNILLVAIITATLVLGTSVIPMQSYAGGSDEHKKGKDFKSIIASSESDKKSANQHMDQDNFCYRGDDCEQANQGQQIAGKDNDAKGFNDQSDNLNADLGTGNGNGNGNGNETNQTPQQKCALCLLHVDLTGFFNITVVKAAGITTTAQLCVLLTSGHAPANILAALRDALDSTTERCLVAAGIDLGGRPSSSPIG
jgi:hypothetical protein